MDNEARGEIKERIKDEIFDCAALKAGRKVGFPIGEGRRRMRKILRFCAAVTVIAMVIAVAVHVFDGSSSGGFLENFGVGGSEESSEEKNESETGGETKNESTENESETVRTESDDGSEEKEEKRIVDRDLSKAEAGDGYMENYTSQLIDTEGLLVSGFGGGKYSYSALPEVLIIYSDTSSGYFDLNKDDPMDVMINGIVAVGERLVFELDRYGIRAVNCTAIHGGDYDEAAETVRSMLKIYPTVRFVIDLGLMDLREEDGSLVRPLAADGSAQLRLTVSSFDKNMRESLALALELRRDLNGGGKRACMPVVLSDSRYSSGYSEYYLKIDVGTSVNGVHEALYAAEELARAFAKEIKLP